MFVVTLTYVAELAEIDAAMGRHMTYLRKQYADGVFLVSGRQIPRVGGIIIAGGVSREDLDARLALDPFVAEGLAEVAVVEFNPSQTAPALKNLLR
ncbi:MAG: hypothetical protein QOF76_5558 [Solirubrobacteraceae bacterium]|jgi:uncharacterized protein YciI|nr:hypothetical protein [Solirubrobacteraceae bacterium]